MQYAFAALLALLVTIGSAFGQVSTRRTPVQVEQPAEQRATTGPAELAARRAREAAEFRRIGAMYEADDPDMAQLFYDAAQAFEERAGTLRGGTSGLAPAHGGLLQNMMSQNMQFLALQNAVQMESRQYQTLSNVAKQRHDIAMAAIRNTRA